MRFCLDNSLPVRHARALNEMVQPDHTFIHLRDRFGPRAKDEDWVRELIQDGDWIVISADHRIDSNPHLRQAWRESGLIVFFLSKAWVTVPPIQQHSQVALILDNIIRRAQDAKPGSAFSVSHNGKIKQLEA